mmetsp:Transcript_52880/g.113340  ORF Transcript_52880/g.113340 Transcript_52880/m.113340 type:complete len:398 (-) Transcript_52880:57-1250(-)
MPKPHRLLCIGNPLIELHAEAPSSLLERFNLQPNASVQAEERHMHLRDELLRGNLKVTFAPGGGAAAAALAALSLVACGEGRTAGEGGGGIQSEQLRSPLVYFLGGVGRDELGVKLKELLCEEGVLPLLSESDDEVTGWRAVLRAAEKPTERDGLGPPPGEDSEGPRMGLVSTATFTGAAREYKLDHLRFKVWESVETARVVYVESLFLTVSVDSVKYVAEHCAKMGNVFCINLSAPYLCRFFYDRILALLPYTDFLFGNEAEYLALAEHRKEEDCKGIDAVVTWLAKLPRADGDLSKRRHVVSTCGKQPTLVASTWQGYGVKVQRYPVPPVRAGRYVCKSGAGDAFAGGFLYALMNDADVDSCVQMALHAGHAAVQRTGPRLTFKDRPQMRERQAA